MSKKKKNILSVVAIIVILLGAFVAFITWRGNPDKILSVANQFQTPASWKLESELVRPPQTVCIDGGSCPEVHRTWIVNTPLTKDVFKGLLTSANWNFAIHNSCNLPQNISGKRISVCTAGGGIEGYDVLVWISQDSTEPKQQRVTLSVRP